MAIYDYAGYPTTDFTWPGGTPSTGETITFTEPSDYLIQISDNDTRLEDGTDDRDDEDGNQIATVYDEFGTIVDSGQVQPREAITISDGTNSFVMHRVFIESSGQSYYIFEAPAPQLNTTYTVTSVSSPNRTSYASLSQDGVVCFGRGTLIETPQGLRRIEALRPGDAATLADGRVAPIRDMGSRRISGDALRRYPNLRPYLILQDAFRPGLPSRSLLLSRQHRVLLRVPDWERSRWRGQDVIGAVHALETAGHIAPICPIIGVEYWHLRLDMHGLLAVGGLCAETFLVTDGYSDAGTDARNDLRLDWCHAAATGAPAMTPVRPIIPSASLRRMVRRVGLPDLAAPAPDRADDHRAA